MFDSSGKWTLYPAPEYMNAGYWPKKVSPLNGTIRYGAPRRCEENLFYTVDNHTLFSNTGKVAKYCNFIQSNFEELSPTQERFIGILITYCGLSSNVRHQVRCTMRVQLDKGGGWNKEELPVLLGGVKSTSTVSRLITDRLKLNCWQSITRQFRDGGKYISQKNRTTENYLRVPFVNWSTRLTTM